MTKEVTVDRFDIFGRHLRGAFRPDEMAWSDIEWEEVPCTEISLSYLPTESSCLGQTTDES